MYVFVVEKRVDGKLEDYRIFSAMDYAENDLKTKRLHFDSRCVNSYPHGFTVGSSDYRIIEQYIAQ